jgi:hypothetical protein
MALHAQIYLITNSFGGRQAGGGIDFVYPVKKIRQCAALPDLQSSEELTADLETKL